MKKYRKKPVVIEAAGPITRGNVLEIGMWVAQNNAGSSGCDSENETYIDIPTLEGTMRASLGDYVIRGVAGEFYPCKPDIFEATYYPA